MPEVQDLPEPLVDGPQAETNQVLLLLAQLRSALRTLEVLGQIVKNFPGSLIGTDKFGLVKECYELGLRTVSMILDVFQKSSADFIDSVLDRVLDNNPQLRDSRRWQELRKKLQCFAFFMIECCCFNIVKRISQAVGHSQLGETYREVREGLDWNSVALIDISIQL